MTYCTPDRRGFLMPIVGGASPDVLESSESVLLVLLPLMLPFLELLRSLELRENNNE